MANIIGGVTNKYNQLFANQFILDLVNQDKIIQRVNVHTLEIFNPASNDVALILRGRDRYAGIGTSVDAQGITIGALRISKDAGATDFPFIRIFNSNATAEYFNLNIKTDKVTAKTFLSRFELSSESDVILNAGANIYSQIAGSNIMQITAQGIKTTSAIEDITTTFVDGSVVDADKNVFVGGIIILNTGLGPASCNIEISPDGVTWFVWNRFAVSAALGDINVGFCAYIPAGWRMKRVGSNFTKSNLFKIRL